MAKPNEIGRWCASLRPFRDAGQPRLTTMGDASRASTRWQQPAAGAVVRPLHQRPRSPDQRRTGADAARRRNRQVGEWLNSTAALPAQFRRRRAEHRKNDGSAAMTSSQVPACCGRSSRRRPILFARRCPWESQRLIGRGITHIENVAAPIVRRLRAPESRPARMPRIRTPRVRVATRAARPSVANARAGGFPSVLSLDLDPERCPGPEVVVIEGLLAVERGREREFT